MKKIIIVILALFMIVSLTGCGKDETNNSGSDQTKINETGDGQQGLTVEDGNIVVDDSNIGGNESAGEEINYYGEE